MKRLKLMTYNIRHGLGMDGLWDLWRTAAVIRSAAPDALCLQEVDRHTPRSFGTDEPALLAQLVPTLPNAEFVKSIDLRNGEYGNAILSRDKAISVERILLPGVCETRSLMACEFADCVVCTMHSSLHDETRMQSLESIASLARRHDKPVFLTGDWNSTPDSEFIAAVSRHFTIISDTSVMTFNAAEPDTCIDYIAVDTAHADAVRALSVEVIPERVASDHRPIIATVEFN